MTDDMQVNNDCTTIDNQVLNVYSICRCINFHSQSNKITLVLMYEIVSNCRLIIYNLDRLIYRMLSTVKVEVLQLG